MLRKYLHNKYKSIIESMRGRREFVPKKKSHAGGSVIHPSYKKAYAEANGGWQSNGDEIAVALSSYLKGPDGKVSMDKVKQVCEENDMDFPPARAKLNPGMIRMNLGNVLRGRSQCRIDGKIYKKTRPTKTNEKTKRIVSMDNLSEAYRIAHQTIERKYESIELCERNNEVFVKMPNRKSAPIKTGNDGVIVQNMDGKEYNARYRGLTENAEIIFLSVCIGEDIIVYEVPGEEYRSQMKREYVQRVEEYGLNKTKQRVLRFDNKGRYTEQRVTEKWEKYRIN